MMINLKSSNDLLSVKFFEDQTIRTTPVASSSSPEITKSGPKSNAAHGPEKHNMTRLPQSFTPGEYDVICARGAEAKNHIGNLNFRKRVAESAESYSKAPSKIFKTLIVTAIIEWVHTQSPDGGFVKRFDGAWYEVGEDIAREKSGQALREMNHSKYKSSMKAKRRRWKQEKQQQQTYRDDDTTNLRDMLRNHYETVEMKWRTFDNKGSDAQMLNLFTQQNNSLLQSLKADDKIQEQISRLV
jgi:hypothetical protein